MCNCSLLPLFASEFAMIAGSSEGHQEEEVLLSHSAGFGSTLRSMKSVVQRGNSAELHKVHQKFVQVSEYMSYWSRASWLRTHTQATQEKTWHYICGSKCWLSQHLLQGILKAPFAPDIKCFLWSHCMVVHWSALSPLSNKVLAFLGICVGFLWALHSLIPKTFKLTWSEST